MKTLLLLCILCLAKLRLCSATGLETLYTAAACDMGDKGAIHFREREGNLEAHIHMHNLPFASARYHIHVHQNGHTPGGQSVLPACEGIGGHFLDSTGRDIGDIQPAGGLSSDASNMLHYGPYALQDLLIDGNDNTQNYIIGRSIAVHGSNSNGGSGAKIACCDIETDTYDADNFGN